MKVELKTIIEQLTEALQLSEGLKVAALIDGEEIVGWTIVTVEEDGSITPIFDKKGFKNLKELIEYYT